MPISSSANSSVSLSKDSIAVIAQKLRLSAEELIDVDVNKIVAECPQVSSAVKMEMQALRIEDKALDKLAAAIVIKMTHDGIIDQTIGDSITAYCSEDEIAAKITQAEMFIKNIQTEIEELSNVYLRAQEDSEKAQEETLTAATAAVTAAKTKSAEVAAVALKESSSLATRKELQPVSVSSGIENSVKDPIRALATVRTAETAAKTKSSRGLHSSTLLISLGAVTAAVVFFTHTLIPAAILCAIIIPTLIYALKTITNIVCSFFRPEKNQTEPTSSILSSSML